MDQLRVEAIKRGDVRYNPRKPCRNGHKSDRYTINNLCVECASTRQVNISKKIMEYRKQTVKPSLRTKIERT